MGAVDAEAGVVEVRPSCGPFMPFGANQSESLRPDPLLPRTTNPRMKIGPYVSQPAVSRNMDSTRQPENQDMSYNLSS